MAIQTVSKIEAATRQLNLAIVLYFQDVDALGVHTLAGAVHGLLEGLLSREERRGARLWRDQRPHVKGMVDDSTNFLKHGARDATGVLKFNTDWTDFVLYDAIAVHMRLAKVLPDSSIFLLIWITAKYPSVSALDMLPADRVAELRRLFPLLGVANAQKPTFLTALNSQERKPAAEENVSD
jgi:hypothetical protein